MIRSTSEESEVHSNISKCYKKKMIEFITLNGRQTLSNMVSNTFSISIGDPPK